MTMQSFRFWGPPPPTKAQWDESIAEYDRYAAHGLEPNDIGDLMGVTRGTACALRRMSLERQGVAQ